MLWILRLRSARTFSGRAKHNMDVRRPFWKPTVLLHRGAVHPHVRWFGPPLFGVVVKGMCNKRRLSGIGARGTPAPPTRDAWINVQSHGVFKPSDSNLGDVCYRYFFGCRLVNTGPDLPRSWKLFLLLFKGPSRLVDSVRIFRDVYHNATQQKDPS